MNLKNLRYNTYKVMKTRLRLLNYDEDQVRNLNFTFKRLGDISRYEKPVLTNFPTFETEKARNRKEIWLCSLYIYFYAIRHTYCEF